MIKTLLSLQSLLLSWGQKKQRVQIFAEGGSDNGYYFRDSVQLLWDYASFDQDDNIVLFVFYILSTIVLWNGLAS